MSAQAGVSSAPSRSALNNDNHIHIRCFSCKLAFFSHENKPPT
jgi:hypothetical protein